MNSNPLRALSLALLVSVAAPVAAAPAPVTDVSSGSGSSVERLERLLEARNNMQIEMQRQLDLMARELDELRGTVERNSYDLGQMLDRQRDLYREIDKVRSSKSVVEPKKEEGGEPSEAYSGNQNENADYEKAVNLILKKKDYAGATAAFDAFLQSYPDSIYRPNAHYWLGQLYFSKSELDQAKTHFEAVNSNKKSSKRADALLKLGLIADRQGDKAGADKFYQQVIKDYPGSTSASQATKALAK